MMLLIAVVLMMAIVMVVTLKVMLAVVLVMILELLEPNLIKIAMQAESLVDVSLAAEGKHLQAHKVQSK